MGRLLPNENFARMKISLKAFPLLWGTSSWWPAAVGPLKQGLFGEIGREGRRATKPIQLCPSGWRKSESGRNRSHPPGQAACGAIGIGGWGRPALADLMSWQA